MKESFMERSDGAIIPICVACGTIPIHNVKLNISICSLCDGPVRFAGDNVNNLEILPPIGRPKSKIVEVAMPYSTKLLTQEQETYLNLTMRYITTSGLTRLNPLEYSGVSSEVVKELPRLILPETVVPAYIEDVPKATVTVEQLRSMGASVVTMTEEERKANDIILEPIEPGQPEPIQQIQLGQLGEPQQLGQQPIQLEPIQLEPQPQQGGIFPPDLSGIVYEKPIDGLIRGPSVPGGGPMIAVRTDREAMMMDGLLEPEGRSIRRNFRPRQMGSQGSMGPGPQTQQTQQVHITKLE